MTYKVQIDDLVRDATEEETERIKANKNAATAQAAAADALAAARASAQKKLAALGLTEEEIGAVLGR